MTDKEIEKLEKEINENYELVVANEKKIIHVYISLEEIDERKEKISKEEIELFLRYVLDDFDVKSVYESLVEQQEICNQQYKKIRDVKHNGMVSSVKRGCELLATLNVHHYKFSKIFEMSDKAVEYKKSIVKYLESLERENIQGER